MNLRQCVFVFVLAGCVSEQETIREVPYIVDREVPVYVDRPVPAPAEDGWQGIEVLPGDLSDFALMQGDDRETLRVDVANHGERNVVALQLPVGIAFDNGDQVTDANAYKDVKFVDRANLYTLMGPLNLNPEVGANIYLNGDGLIRAGETTTFVLRMDIAAAPGRYQVTVGSLAALLEDVVYEDTLERVPADMIRNNRIIGRNFEVLQPPADMPTPSPDGPVALVGNFSGMTGTVLPDSGWQQLGMVHVSTFGGRGLLRAIQISGWEMLAFQSYALMAGDALVGQIEAHETFNNIPLDVPVVTEEGTTVSYRLLGFARRDDDPSYRRGTEVGLGLDALDVVSADGEASVQVFLTRDLGASRFRFFRSIPVVTTLPLDETFENGVISMLARERIASSNEAPIYIGARGYQIQGLASGALSYFSVIVDGTFLAPEDFTVRLVYGDPDIDLKSGTLDVRDPGAPGFASVVVIFTRPIAASLEGTIISLMAVPSEFPVGDGVTVSSSYRGFSGMLGTLDRQGALGRVDDGSIRLEYDALVWIDDLMSGTFTGSWGIAGLDAVWSR